MYLEYCSLLWYRFTLFTTEVPTFRRSLLPPYSKFATVPKYGTRQFHRNVGTYLQNYASFLLQIHHLTLTTLIYLYVLKVINKRLRIHVCLRKIFGRNINTSQAIQSTFMCNTTDVIVSNISNRRSRKLPMNTTSGNDKY